MVFVKNLEGRTIVVNGAKSVDDLKAHIAAVEAIPSEEQRLIFAGHQLEDGRSLRDYGICFESTVHLDLRLIGGGKKRKKKQYTTPKKNKHKRKKVKLAVLKYYKVDENGKINRLRKECPSPTCGGGVFMASHQDRYYCGKCYQTLVMQDPREKVAGSKK
ncbi:hypothetical protein AB6A40_009894 [Gnathostoma spinigerum]|uniref:Ubiquitin-like domain-containing protein n=1 Tax=Gnathostoma spinigerum TaxID=75299 RepID=A0ABD6EUJ2_9BILA